MLDRLHHQRRSSGPSGPCSELPRGRRCVRSCLRAAAAALALWALPISAATVSPDDAAKHISQTATVCGVVASTKFDAHLRSQPTFLDFGKPYPDQVFSAVILRYDRGKFGTPETTLQGKRVCVSGKIREYRGKPEIILTDPKQLTQ
jgi:hypothetical protein